MPSSKTPRRDQQRLVYDAIDKDFSESVEVEEMVDWLEKDPRAAKARAANEKLLRSQEDRNIGEITLPPYVISVRSRRWRAHDAIAASVRVRGPRRRRTRDAVANAGTSARSRTASPTKFIKERGPRRPKKVI